MKNKRMNVVNYILIIIILVLISVIVFGLIHYTKLIAEYENASSNNQNTDVVTVPEESEDQYIYDVTMVELIANPEKYDGKLVRVIGVGNLEFEGNYISLSKDDWKYNTDNQIWIELGDIGISYEEAKKYNGKYVIVEGIFDKDSCGHFDMFCGSINNISRYQEWNTYITFRATVIQDKDGLYSYEITDYEDYVLVSEKDLTDMPIREYIDDDIIGITVQAGTGLSTKRTIYCDLENSRVSETFYYVLAVQDDYVIYADNSEGAYSIVIQNMFDRSEYYRTYELENVSPIATDFVAGCKLKNKGCAVVTYFSGDDYNETDIEINFP